MALRDPKPIPGSVCLGVITGARGVRGEIKIKPFTDEPLALDRYGPLHDGRGNRLAVKPRALAKGLVLATVEGVSDRAEADSIKGAGLYIEREILPEPEEDQFYHADLIGLAAIGTDGRDFGEVRGVFDFGAGDVLELADSVHGVLMVPFTKVCVPAVNVVAGRVVVDPPLGLLEPGESEPTGDGGNDA